MAKNSIWLMTNKNPIFYHNENTTGLLRRKLLAFKALTDQPGEYYKAYSIDIQWLFVYQVFKPVTNPSMTSIVLSIIYLFLSQLFI